MLSQQELADRAGTSLFTIQRIERGEGNVRPRTGRAVAAALGIPIEDLLPKAQAPLWSDESPAERRLDDEAALAILFRGLARRAWLIVERSRREGPSAALAEDLAALQEEESALYRLRGRRDILGRKSEELVEAEAAYEEVGSTIQAMLRQDLEATDEERREARRFRAATEETRGSQEADAS
jgi:DNA-binding XRE family transcriptional regulator